MNQNKTAFFWRIISSHMTAYFIAGLFAVIFMNYREHYSSESLSLLMKPVDSPIVALGPGLQFFRGFIIALILLPFFKSLELNNRNIIKLGIVYFGLTFISTIGPSPGSFEGYIYTTLPLRYHLLGIPEAVIYTALFIAMIWIWYKKELKIFNVISVMLVIIICIFSVLGYLKGIGILNN